VSASRAGAAGPGRGATGEAGTAPGPLDPAARQSTAGSPASTGSPATTGSRHAAGSRDTTGSGRIRAWLRGPSGRRAAAHLLLLACYIGAGVIVTWPMTARLADGQLLKVPDVSSYVWALWWMAHQVAHLGDPWFTHYMAAPPGIQLGFDTLMPLPGLVMLPVTLLIGPAASFGVLTVVMPGLLCYVTYRAARLWLGQPGAIAAGAFFGLATMATWQNLYHLNISIGTLFLPLTLEAAVRLRRSPGRRQGIILGLVLGASVLTNQESAVLATLLAAAVLVPWLVRMLATRPGRAGSVPPLRTLALGAVVAIVVASPQLLAMLRQVTDGGTTIAPSQVIQLTQSYRNYGVGVPALFAPSPRLGHFNLGHLATAYQFAEPTEGIPTFGIVLAALAVIGLALSWRRKHSWALGLLWLAGAALALGPTLIIGNRTFIPLAERWHDVTVSPLLPYTWLIRIPGLSALREADRLALLGLLGAAVLAGAAIQWLCDHARPVLAAAVIVVVAAAGFMEAGWSATGAPMMRAAMPSVDGPIAADRSHSVVVDVPFGLRGGVGVTGFRMPPQALVLATADGHPRAVSYTSWVPQPTINGITRIPFYRCLYGAQGGIKFACHGQAVVNARHSARRADIGWVISWHSRTRAARPTVIKYLYETGFHIDYQVTTGQSGITVWRRG
jgi:hypothetical protein